MKVKMSKLFSPITIGRQLLINRFVRSATSECLATEAGGFTEELRNLYAQLAGGPGLIISGNAFVSRTGKSEVKMISAADDKFLPDLEGLAKSIAGSGSKFILQLLHCGGQTLHRISGAEILAPSPGNYYGDEARSMTISEIKGTIDAYVEAAVRAEKAGFDGIQLHAAHGYLISQFLSPKTNLRTDQYGGNLEQRSGFLLEIIKGIRQSTSSDFLILAKINGSDFTSEGLMLAETKLICQKMEAAGLDAVEISGGTVYGSRQWIFGEAPSQPTEGYFREFASEIKQIVKIPVILVGGLRNVHLMEEIVESGDAD